MVGLRNSIFNTLLFSLVFGYAGKAPAQSNTASSPLMLSLEAQQQPVSETAQNIVESFGLTILNTGNAGYSPEPSVKVLDIKITSVEKLSSHLSEWTCRSTDDLPFVIAPKEEKTIHINCEAPTSELQEGRYRAHITLWNGETTDTYFEVMIKRRSPIIADFLFTGRLFGYYRLPDQQPLAVPSTVTRETPCPAREEASALLSPDANSFMEYFRKLEPASILVGTGDNFAPNYYSRAFFLGPETQSCVHESGRLAGKELYNWDESNKKWACYQDVAGGLQDTIRQGVGIIPTDNVGCFLAYAGYSAVVPGVHDFYFGPERLRELARFLAGIRQSGYQPVQMLAANLVIKTAWATDHKPVSDKLKPQLRFLTRYIGLTNDQTVEIQDFSENGSVYPWMRRIKIKAKNVPDLHPILCKAVDGDPDDLISKDDPTQCREKIDTLALLKASDDKETREYSLTQKKPLTPGANYAICVPNPNAKAKDRQMYCFRFSVFKPFFQTPPSTSGQATSCAHFLGQGDYVDPEPYVVVDSKPTPVAIFGVVDPRLRTLVGGLNFAWKNMKASSDHPDARYKTDIAVTDPVKALVQLQQCFVEERPQFNGIRVLLAQMPPAAATALAAKMPLTLRFDVVISEADDSLATPNQTVTLTPNIQTEDQPRDGTNILPQSFIAVPPTESKFLSRRWVQVRRLHITSTGSVDWTFTVKGVPAGVKVSTPAPEREQQFWEVVNTTLNKALRTNFTASGIDEKIRNIQYLTLYAIQRHTNADVALLQARDFYPGGISDYFSEHCNKPNGLQDACAGSMDYQEILERILWKGDFLMTRAVTGSVLKKVLEQSKKYKEEEDSPTYTNPERYRYLVYAGIHKDEARDEWVINDVPLDAGKLYIIATTDYVSLGDTGYPDLETPPVGEPPREILATQKLQTMSGLVCHMVMKYAGNSLSGINCNPEIDPRGYYDEVADVAPSDSREGNTVLHQLRLWSFFHGRLGERLSAQQKRAEREKASKDIGFVTDQKVQDRSTWQFSLDKLSLGFSGLWHVQDETAVQQDFSGLRNTQVTAKRFHSWETEVTSKLTRFMGFEDWFFSDSLRYSSKFTSNPGNPRLIDQPVDSLVFEAGSYIHLRSGKRLPQLQWLVAGHFETQAFTPFGSVTLNPLVAEGSSSTLTFPLDRSRLVLGRTGPRWQNRKSFFQLGGEGGVNLDAITQFNVLTAKGGSLIVPCPLNASRSLGKCVNTFNKSNPPTPVTANSFVQTLVDDKARYGIFWDSVLDVPFHPKLTFRAENSGDYFFPASGDTSTDTRFRHQYSQSVKFLVFPNLGFEPTYTIFLFENKVDNHFLFQQQFAIKITYSFVWSNWYQTRQQLRYQKQ